MKKLVLAVTLLPALGCASGEDNATGEGGQTSLRAEASQVDAEPAPDTQKLLATEIRGTTLYHLPAALKEAGVNLELSPALSDRTLDFDSRGMKVGQVLDRVASSVGGRLTYTSGTYRIMPVVIASESPVPQSSAQGQPVLMGALPKDDILRVINTNKAGVRYCYEKALNGGKPNLEGELAIHWIIEPSGKVGTANVKKDSSTLEDAETEACILDIVRKMVFPEPTGGGIVEVNYPFVFKAN